MARCDADVRGGNVMPSTAWAQESTVTFKAIKGTAGFNNESFDKLIDGKYTSEDGTKWCLDFPSEGAYIIFSASEAIQVTGYSIVTGNDNAENTNRNPQRWAIYGCNDASADRDSKSWVLIDEVTNDTKLEDSNYQKYDFTLSNPSSEKYQYFKMEIIDYKGAEVMQMSELILTYVTCNHNWVATGGVVPPTCTEKGYDVYECSLCQLTKNVENENLALGHDWVDGTTVPPTCTADGYTPQTCSRCPAEQKINIVNATGHQWGTDDICDVCRASNTEPSKPAGEGTAANPYKIGTAGELYWFAALVNGDTSIDGVTAANAAACAQLTADITMNSQLLSSLQYDDSGNVTNGASFRSWTTIGNDYTWYTGTFDGNGKTISGLYFNNGSKTYVGLFGWINGGTIKNVSVVDSYIYGFTPVGGLCGQNGGTISNCCYKGSVGGDMQVGGVCGNNAENGTITNCYKIGAVSGNHTVGGVCGQNFGGSNTITNCYNIGTVSIATVGDNNEFFGGVCGTNIGNSTITNCYYNSQVYTGNALGNNSDHATNVEGKTTAQFKSGEVAYLLQGDQESSVWGQTIGTEDYPVLNSKKVYYGYTCGKDDPIYSNLQLAKDGKPENHKYNNGFCQYCDDLHAATLNKSGEYEIGNAGQLCWFAGLVNGTLTDGTQQNKTAKGVLTDNIDLASISNWTPIGNESNKFGGTFDGKNFKVQHMSITQQGYNTGLFGYANEATMQNICIEGNITLTTTGYTEGYGSIAGRMDNSTISNCHSSVNFTINTEKAASEECIGHMGGIVGKMHEANCAVQGCSYSGIMNLGNNNVKVAAGIVGYAINNKVPITNCSFTGTIKSKYTGALYMGGIFGYTNSGGEVKVTKCLQAGTLEKDGNSSLTGMLIGQIKNGYGSNAVTNNYYISGKFNVIGTIEGTPTTTPATQCSTEQLQSGEICYLLNGSSPDGAWGQQIGTDGYPVPGSDKKVYEVNLLCGGVKAVGKTYANSNEDVTIAHKLPETASFNSEKKIYNKVCQREACGETVYYANASGTIEATPNAGATVFTVANYPLQDATTYDNQAVFTATNFTYTRTFSNTNWTTWYVPFDLTLTSDICAQYDFSRINNVHQYDTDNDGTADKTVVESFRQMPGVTLKANYPYLVKPVSEGDMNMVLNLEGVIPAMAEKNSIDCQSVDYKYTFTGTYTAMGKGGSSYYDPYTLWTDGTWQHFRSLDPMRHYLTVTQRNSSFASAASLRSIMLSVIGDEGTTGIVNMYSDERKAAQTYDLGGSRLPAGASQKGVVIENGKVIIKK